MDARVRAAAIAPVGGWPTEQAEGCQGKCGARGQNRRLESAAVELTVVDEKYPPVITSPTSSTVGEPEMENIRR